MLLHFLSFCNMHKKDTYGHHIICYRKCIEHVTRNLVVLQSCTVICGKSSTDTKQLHDQLLYEAHLPHFGQSINLSQNQSSSSPYQQFMMPSQTGSSAKFQQCQIPSQTPKFIYQILTIRYAIISPNNCNSKWYQDIDDFPLLLIGKTFISSNHRTVSKYNYTDCNCRWF